MASTGESADVAGYFESIKEIKDAAGKGYLSLLYIYDTRDGDKLKKFQSALFANEDLGVALKVFRKVGLDIAKDSTARQLYENKVPHFITFDAKGQRAGELHLEDYRTKSSDLMKLLVKTAKGHGKLPLKSFVKKYRSFLNELDQVEGKKDTCAQKKSRATASGSKKKLAKVEKEAQSIAKREKSILSKEANLLASVKAYDGEAAANKATGSTTRAAPGARARARGGS